MRSFHGLFLVIVTAMMMATAAFGLRSPRFLQKTLSGGHASLLLKKDALVINRSCTSLCAAKGGADGKKQPESAKHRRERTKENRSRQEIMPENNYGVLGNMDGSGGSAAISWCVSSCSRYHPFAIYCFVLSPGGLLI